MSVFADLRAHLKAIRTLAKGVTGGLADLSRADDPIERFADWYRAAREAGILLPESVALATATPDGRPSVRMVLLKGVDERGFRFFTNYGSRKADELDRNPRAAMCFHWAVIERQVRIEGSVERISKEESEAYFRSRPRGSQVGAWASRQSDEIESREALERQAAEVDAEYAGRDTLPLPPFWGGYLLVPERIELWQGRLNRLHDRLRYTRREDGGWDVVRLQP